MRLQQVLDDLLEMLEAEEEGKHFKTLGALRKSKFQNNKSEDELFLKSDMYAGTIGNSEAVKKGHITRKKHGIDKIINKKAAAKRKAWYQDPENKKKFQAIIAKRDAKRKNLIKNKKGND